MYLFPYDELRPSQKECISQIGDSLQQGENVILHAPTGLGKTVASLGPALTVALESGYTVFFLTSRHTQHEIALKTLRDIQTKHGCEFQAVDIIGKKWMCAQPGTDRLQSGEFSEFCKTLREDRKCEFFDRLKSGEKLLPEGKLVVEKLSKEQIINHKSVLKTAKDMGVCPYYTSMEMAKSAQVIISDYYYIFHDKIRDRFFTQSDNDLGKAIIIVDEAHNLPARIKDLASAKLSSWVIIRAIAESKKYAPDLTSTLEKLLNLWDRLAPKQGEGFLEKQKLIDEISMFTSYDGLSEECDSIGSGVRERERVSMIGSIASFLFAWEGRSEGFARIVQTQQGARGPIVTVWYKCLDPRLIVEPIVKEAHSTIMMSGTLTPTAMYRDVLGMQNTKELNYPNPFPEKNRKVIIIPKTSTKFTKRSKEQFLMIAKVLEEAIGEIPGNVAVFFPSYLLLSAVSRHFSTMTEKTVFTEQPEMSTVDKQNFLDNFRKYKDSGAVLLGVISGNFGEGIDLPGDELKGVVIVGLPLQKPNLETESLIAYYDKRFRRGWDYGYLYPAFNKALQSAGRCIRSEHDQGVIIFLDERYAWPQYKRCFPPDWEVSISLDYAQLIRGFFGQEGKS